MAFSEVVSPILTGEIPLISSSHEIRLDLPAANCIRSECRTSNVYSEVR